MWWAGGKAEPRNTPPMRTPSPVSTNEMHRLPLRLLSDYSASVCGRMQHCYFGVNMLMRRERGISKADWRSCSGRGGLVYHVWRQPGSMCPVVTRFWWTCILMPLVVELCSFKGMDAALHSRQEERTWGLKGRLHLLSQDYCNTYW